MRDHGTKSGNPAPHNVRKQFEWLHEERQRQLAWKDHYGPMILWPCVAAVIVLWFFFLVHIGG